jgi:hypothetical protein
MASFRFFLGKSMVAVIFHAKAPRRKEEGVEAFAS